MKRGIDGHIIVDGERVRGQEPRGRSYTRKTVRDMTTRWLRSQLCSRGPKKCPTCGLCEYGKEYARRAQEKRSEEAETT